MSSGTRRRCAALSAGDLGPYQPAGLDPDWRLSEALELSAAMRMVEHVRMLAKLPPREDRELLAGLRAAADEIERLLVEEARWTPPGRITPCRPCVVALAAAAA